MTKVINTREGLSTLRVSYTLLYWFVNLSQIGFFADFLYKNSLYRREAIFKSGGGGLRSAPFCALVSLKRGVRAAWSKPTSRHKSSESSRKGRMNSIYILVWLSKNTVFSL